jgi:hypothetical protein
MMVDQLNGGIHQPIQRRALGRLGGRAIEQVVAGDARLVLGWCLAGAWLSELARLCLC